MIKSLEDHNNLNVVTDQLRVDGHDEMAEAYGLRQAAAEKGYVHLRRLGDECKARTASYAGDQRDRRVEIGKGLADWLTDYGWTPPWPLEIEPDSDED